MTTPLWKRIIARILEALLAIIFISPLVWVIICSFSPQAGSAQSKGWGVANYLTLFGYQEGLPKYLFNSVIVTLVAVVFSVVVCTLAGYSFSRFDYPGRNLGFMVTLSILMVPYASLLIPLMVWYKQIGLNDSLLGVGLVITLFQLPMSTFIMRNAFDAIPKDMEEAAMVDGCNSLQALFKILVPVVKPSMVTVGLLAFLEAWNNFMIPLYLSSSSKSTLPLAMVNMRQQTMGVIDYGATEAGVVILLIPCAILFLALQKYYVKGFMAGAVKGWGVANYLTLFGYQEGLPKYLFNSVIVTLVAVVFSVVVCTLAGYSFSRFDYPGRNLGFMVTLSILMVPYASLLIPLMVWYKQIGLNDSLLGVGLVITLFQLPMSTFIMRNAFDAIPKDMEEAAMVDGCNSLQALFKILVPVVKPSMVTVGLLAFLEAWNNFMIPLYLSSSSKSTLPLAMVNMRQQTMGVIDYGATEAGVVILLIPCAILFLALQKYYVKGFMAGAVKG